MGELRIADIEVVMPESAAEAVGAFADGTGVTVFAGGTILMPELSYGRYPRTARTLMLHRAGLDQVTGDETVTIGAMTTLGTLAEMDLEPLAAAAGDVADFEVRAQATVGGNLCAPPGAESPRGDLRAPLLALGARVRSAGAGGERTEPVEDFLARRVPDSVPDSAGGNGEARLVLAIEVDRSGRAAYVSLRRPHAHSYAVMSVACAQAADGVRVAASGVGPRALRLSAVEGALAEGSAPAAAAAKALDGLDPHDDALASAWYRRSVLPTLVTRALQQLQGG